jgi:hypothetical protein
MLRHLLLSFCVLLCSLPESQAFTSPRVSCKVHAAFRTQVKSCCSLRASNSDSETDKTEPTSVVDDPSAVSDEEITDILKGGTLLESIADTAAKEDPFGVVRMGVAAILCLGGLANLAGDASKFGASVEGGYALGSGIMLAIDTAFTAAMAGALYKEWQKMQE